MSIPELTTGTVFAGYQIDGVAGEGGMGVVYRATEIALQRPVALKLIAEDFAGDRKFRERFQRESMLAASIDHPNVIPVYEAGEVDGELYIAMRFVDGTDLLHAVTREGALEPARAVRIVSQVAAALDAAHRRGLVHRDVKPGNVLLTGEGDEEHAYLTDFGLVKTLTGDIPGTTTAGHFVGTLDYSSPEAIQGQDADARSDVYSLACVLYFTLTRTSPFLRDSNVGTMFAHVNEPPPSLLEENPKLPPALAAVVEKGLAKNPDERHQTAGEFARAAQEALAAGGARPAPRRAAPAAHDRRRRPAAPQPRARDHPPRGPRARPDRRRARRRRRVQERRRGRRQPSEADAKATATATRHRHRRPRPPPRRPPPPRSSPRSRPARAPTASRSPTTAPSSSPTPARARSSASTRRRTRRSASRSPSARRPTASPAPRRSPGSPRPATTRSAASRATPTRS